MIRDGFDVSLDELRDATRGGKDWIAKLQADEIGRTGITSLKVRFNSVFATTSKSPNRISTRSAALHPQADRRQWRTLHHAGVEEMEGKNPRRGGTQREIGI